MKSLLKLLIQLKPVCVWPWHTHTHQGQNNKTVMQVLHPYGGTEHLRMWDGLYESLWWISNSWAFKMYWCHSKSSVLLYDRDLSEYLCSTVLPFLIPTYAVLLPSYNQCWLADYQLVFLPSLYHALLSPYSTTVSVFFMFHNSFQLKWLILPQNCFSNKIIT